MINRDFIRERRLRLGMSQNDLAIAVGVTAPAITQWEGGKTEPRGENRERLAEALQCQVSDLYGHTSTLSISTIQAMPIDVPVIATAEYRQSGVFNMYPREVIGHVRRPPAFSSKKLFSVYMHGDLMEPLFFAGDHIYVDPIRPPQRGYPVLIQFKAEKGLEMEAMIRILVRQTPSLIEIRQLNPYKTASIEVDKAQHVWRVLTYQDLIAL